MTFTVSQTSVRLVQTSHFMHHTVYCIPYVYSTKGCCFLPFPPLPTHPTHLAAGVTSVSIPAAVCRPLLAPLVLLRALWVSTLSRAFLSVPSASPSAKLPADDGLRCTEP